MAGSALIKQGDKARAKVLRFLNSYIKKHRYAPSIAEIAEGVGLSATTVRYHLGVLEEDRAISMETGKTRTIRVL